MEIRKRQDTISCPVNMLLIFVFVRAIVEITWSGIQSCDHINLRTVRLFITLVSLENQCVSIHRPLDSLFKALFRLTNIITVLYYWPLVGGINWLPADSPHKGLVRRRVLWCHHIMMWLGYFSGLLITWCQPDSPVLWPNTWSSTYSRELCHPDKRFCINTQLTIKVNRYFAIQICERVKLAHHMRRTRPLYCDVFCIYDYYSIIFWKMSTHPYCHTELQRI